MPIYLSKVDRSTNKVSQASRSACPAQHVKIRHSLGIEDEPAFDDKLSLMFFILSQIRQFAKAKNMDHGIEILNTSPFFDKL